MRLRFLPLLLSATLIAGCAGRKAEVAVVAPPVAPTVAYAPMPAGGRPGMMIPARLGDGSYATPNRNLSAAGATWHLRAALNVAALACRGPDEAVIVARYNALLTTQKAALAVADHALIAEYRTAGVGTDWRDRYDDAMTRLYNFFAQDFAHNGFCEQARQALAQTTTLQPGTLDAFAAAWLPQLERPFTDFYAAYDAWREQRIVPGTAPLAPTNMTQQPVAPRLTVNVATLGG